MHRCKKKGDDVHAKGEEGRRERKRVDIHELSLTYLRALFLSQKVSQLAIFHSVFLIEITKQFV